MPKGECIFAYSRIYDLEALLDGETDRQFA